MDALFVIVVALLLVAMGLFVSSRFDVELRIPYLKKKADIGAATRKSSSAQWRAVKIYPGLISCQAAGKMAGQTYLSQEAPTLPLEGCTEKKCSCKYSYLDDRRDREERRDTPEFLAALESLNRERRDSNGRRTTDTQS